MDRYQQDMDRYQRDNGGLAGEIGCFAIVIIGILFFVGRALYINHQNKDAEKQKAAQIYNHNRHIIESMKTLSRNGDSSVFFAELSKNWNYLEVHGKFKQWVNSLETRRLASGKVTITVNALMDDYSRDVIGAKEQQIATEYIDTISAICSSKLYSVEKIEVNVYEPYYLLTDNGPVFTKSDYDFRNSSGFSFEFQPDTSFIMESVSKKGYAVKNAILKRHIQDKVRMIVKIPPDVNGGELLVGDTIKYQYTGQEIPFFYDSMTQLRLHGNSNIFFLKLSRKWTWLNHEHIARMKLTKATSGKFVLAIDGPIHDHLTESDLGIDADSISRNDIKKIALISLSKLYLIEKIRMKYHESNGVDSVEYDAEFYPDSSLVRASAENSSKLDSIIIEKRIVIKNTASGKYWKTYYH